MAILSRRVRLVWAFGLAAPVVGCALLTGLGLTGGTPYAFPHALHVKDQGLDCDACHAGAIEGAAAGMPELSQCMLCHQEMDGEKPPERRASHYFPNGAMPTAHVKVLPAGTKFSHAAHAGRNVACTECHGDVTAAGWAPATAGRLKADCMGCHAERQVRNDCATCHDEWRRDTPPGSHAENWRRVHGGRARAATGASQDQCALCHTESACAACHRTQQPESHSPHWRQVSHGLAASLDREACSVCHESDSCNRCHQETAPRSHRAGWGSPRDTHCLDCHWDSQSSCTVCHSGTPSHATATPKPSWHVAGMNCRLCHGAGAPLPHVDSGANCESCHK